MSLITKMLRYQKCVYWPPLGRDEDGDMRFGDPEETGCRWEDKNEQIVDDRTGATVVSKSRVFVGMDMKPGGMIRLGDMDSVEYQPDPHQNDDVFEIRSVNKTPDKKAKEFLRWVYV